MDYLSASAITALFPEMMLSLPYYGVTDARPVMAAITVVIVLNIIFWALRRIVIERLKAVSERTSTDIDDVIIDALRSIRAWVYTIVSVFMALQFFVIPELVDIIMTAIFLFAIVWQAIEVVVTFVDYFAMRVLEKDEDGDGMVDPNAATASHMVTLLARIVLWALGGLFVLSNLGIEITSLIAGLGIGGIAVAFALQGILSDLFASFSLYFDKPFRIGDFIVIGSDMGTVEKIGIKSTRIRTLQGEELVVSNAELTTARVQNFKKMDERRVVAQFGITYETPQEKVKQVPGVVTRIFEHLEKARLDRVHFSSFGDFALLFEVVYYIESSDYNEYMDIQQQYNFELMARFSELGIEFAYPTQTIYTKSVT